MPQSKRSLNAIQFHEWEERRRQWNGGNESGNDNENGRRAFTFETIPMAAKLKL